MLRIKRVYDSPSPEDGFRILVDRLWPRGMSKEKAHIDLWLKDIAPSGKLRTWFSHDRTKWQEFKNRYAKELRTHTKELETITKAAKNRAVTLLFSSKEETYNNAVALKEYLKT